MFYVEESPDENEILRGITGKVVRVLDLEDNETNFELEEFKINYRKKFARYFWVTFQDGKIVCIGKKMTYKRFFNLVNKSFKKGELAQIASEIFCKRCSQKNEDYEIWLSFYGIKAKYTGNFKDFEKEVFKAQKT